MKWKTISKIGATNKERTNRMMKMFNKAKVHGPLTGTNELILSSLVVGSLALPLITEAGQQQKKEHPRYKLIDLGTFGGPAYYLGFSGIPPLLLNEQGTVIGGMDTTIPDPFCINSDCLVSHAFQWQEGVLIDLGLHASSDFSQAFWINNRGVSIGVSLGAGQDQSGLLKLKALLWNNGQVSELATLGGDQSMAQAINNRD